MKKGDVKVLVDALKAHLGGTINAFADADQTNPFVGNQRLLFPWAHVEKKGLEGLHAHCISFSGLPPQV